MGSVVDTENWYQEYKDRANFLMVYVEEAHPGNTVDGRRIDSARDIEEKRELAQYCTAGGHLSLPTVLDKLDNAVEIAYAAFPDRIYVLDSDGIVRHKSMPGPSGWDVGPAREALDGLLAGADAAGRSSP